MKRRQLWMLLWVALLALGAGGAARAQTITFPQAGQQVRGTIKVTFEGVPEGGYVMLYLDGTGMTHLKTATAETSYLLNTFAMPEGQHTLTIIAFNAGGKRVGTSDVSFAVANTSVDTSVPGVNLRVWTINDRLNDVVRRYRISAESNATIEGGSAGGDSGGGGGASAGAAGMAGAGGDEQEWIPAPIDWQIDLLVRSLVRDVGLADVSANVRSIVQEGFQRQRISEEGQTTGTGGTMPGAGGGTKRKRKKKGPTAPVKAPWGVWKNSVDTGRYFVKTVKADGEEINATKKTTTLAIGDLLPNFPDAEVHPGSTWTTQMSLVGDIPDSTGIRVQAPMTFVAFENVITPNGITKRCAKLESRFTLPQATAEKIGHAIQAKIGSGGAGGAATAQQGGMGTMGGPNSGGTDEEPIDFKVISTNVSRLIWFDITGNQVVRSTDSVDTHYEEEEEEAEDGGGGMGGAGGAGAGGGGTKVSYSLRITRYLDDRVPEPTRSYTNGRGTAHARDSVTDATPQKAISGR